MSRHTPGPWLVLQHEYYPEKITIAATSIGQAICRIKNDVSSQSLTSEDYANARLIAAAPALLATLESLVEAAMKVVQISDRNHEAWVTARVAMIEAQAAIKESGDGK